MIAKYTTTTTTTTNCNGKKIKPRKTDDAQYSCSPLTNQRPPHSLAATDPSWPISHVYILGIMFYGMEYPYSQLMAALAMLPPIFLCRSSGTELDTLESP